MGAVRSVESAAAGMVEGGMAPLPLSLPRASPCAALWLWLWLSL
jgi:hypothetical protein